MQTLALIKPPKGDRLAIATNGVGVMATDALMDHGGKLAELHAETLLTGQKVSLEHRV
ncbi:MAG: hypothetical protein HC871_05655 [Rhizobiales bacterium]|nr:hypothetical protein [Hyphomicrobiales bacterium]